ncbi:hypothetical protein BsWGS_27564 [Bradybaena similaris]
MSSRAFIHAPLNRFHLLAVIALASAGTVLTLWKLLRRQNIDDDASQLCRLVSPRRSKDDDKRMQLQRKHESRQQSPPRSLDMCSEQPVLKRQNTI